jgi:hypothetical protein
MLNELQLYTPVLGNLCQNSDLHMGYTFDPPALFYRACPELQLDSNTDNSASLFDSNASLSASVMLIPIQFPKLLRQ